SATRARSLIEDRVDLGSESLAIDRRCAREQSDGGLRADEPTLSQRCQFADRDAIAGDDERLAAVERSHDLAALVSKLPLRDLSRHRLIVAHVLHNPRRAATDICSATPGCVWRMITQLRRPRLPRRGAIVRRR